MKYHEPNYHRDSEWRTGKPLLDKIGLQYAIDPCAPCDGGYYAVPALRKYTLHDKWPA